jgi:hypothetical protein
VVRFTRCRKPVDRSDTLTGKFAKEFAQTGALSTNERDITGTDLAEIESVGF